MREGSARNRRSFSSLGRPSLDLVYMNPHHTLGIILARAGSKGLPRKNVLPIAGRPMIAWTIDAALAAERLDAICVTTDLPEAAAVANASSLFVIDRPAGLADDRATVDAAARHAVLEYERAFQPVTHVVLLYANIPFRDTGIIDASVDKLIETGADSVRSVAPVDKMHPDWMHRLDGDHMIQFRPNSIYRRQDLVPLFYHDGGVIAVTRESLFQIDEDNPHAFFGLDRRGVVAARPAIDVDTADDAQFAESMLEKKSPRVSLSESPIASLLGAAAPYVIAEIGVNHDGCIAKAHQLIDAAKLAGADAVKFQIFSADALASVDARTCDYQRINTDTIESQRDMLCRLELSRDALRELRDAADKAGLDFIATPFGIEELTFLDESLDPAAIKTSSSDLVNLPLLMAAAKTDRPLIVSTGASDWSEVVAGVETLRAARSDGRLALLHCVSAYPTPLEQVQLAVIGRMQRTFDVIAGFSDHTMESETGGFAVLAGARILEKHITLDRAARGPDHAASLEPAAFSDYVRGARRAALLLGSADRRCLDIEQDVRQVARGRLVVKCRIHAGATITADALTVQRPGDGISPTDLGRVIGRTAAQNIECNTPLTWNMMSSQA